MAAAVITSPATQVESRPWPVSFAYMLLLGGFFYASYGFSNWVASRLDHVPTIAFAWERNIPFLEWTIVPYWSLNLFFCLSFFVCRTRLELDRHALRLLTAQTISVAVFLAMPLGYSFERPQPGAAFGWMFAALASFDRPFNQAPSLHLSITMIVAVRLSAHLDGFWRWLLRIWFVLIGVSALTTYQHHFLDIPTGIWAGAFCCALFPDEVERKFEQNWNHHVGWGGVYCGGFVLLSVVAMWIGGWAWWLLWPSGACMIVGLIYLRGDPALFQKQNGSMPAPMRWLLAPYLAVAWLNSRWWTLGKPPACEIAPGVWIGRLPIRRERDTRRFASMVDLTAELPVHVVPAKYQNVPVLDLTVPTAAQLDHLVSSSETFKPDRPTLVCCALGYARSAAAVAAWLVATGRASSVEAAIAIIERRRTCVSLTAAHRRSLQAWALERNYVAAAPSCSRVDDMVSPGPFGKSLARILVLIARVLVGVEARWVGCPPSEIQRIYVANHTSHADFVVLWGSLPPHIRRRTHPVAAADYWNSSAIRRYFTERVFGAVLVQRNSIDREHINPLEPIFNALRSYRSLILFPEGTRGHGEELLPFKCGIYHIAHEHPNVELVPVWIANLHRVLPKGTMMPLPLLCSVTFGEPVHIVPGEDKREFLVRLRKAVIETGESCSSTLTC